MEKDSYFPMIYGNERKVVVSLGQLGAWGQTVGQLLWSMLQKLLYKGRSPTGKGWQGGASETASLASESLCVYCLCFWLDCPPRMRAKALIKVVPIFPSHKEPSRLRAISQGPTHPLLKECLFHDLHIVSLHSCFKGLVPSAVKSL